MRSSAWIWLFSSTHSTSARSGGLQIQPHDVADLLDEERILRELERLACDAAAGRRRARCGGPCCGSARTPSPSTACSSASRPRRRLQRLGQHALDLRIGDRARGPGPRLIQQAVEPRGQKPRAPLARPSASSAAAPGDRGVRLARGTAEHDARALRQRLRGLRPPAQRSSVSRSSSVNVTGGVGRPGRMGVLPFYNENASAAQIVPLTSGTGH